MGISGSGRSYVHAGGHGLYYRSSLDSPASRTRPRTAASDRIEIYENTGVTYREQDQRDQSRDEGSNERTSSSVLWFIAALVLIFVLPPVGWVLLAVLLIRAGLRLYRRHLVSSTEQKLRALVNPPRPLASGELEQIRSTLEGSRLGPKDRASVAAGVYREVLEHVLDDEVITDEEWLLLTTLERTLIDYSDAVTEEKLAAFRSRYLAAVADHELTPDEEATLDHLRDRLGLPAEAITEELQTLATLREIRQIRDGQLPEVDPGVRLQRGETCHFVGVGRLLKSKVLRTFQQDGQRYNVRGFTIDKEGRLLITNKRILLVHSGTTSVRLDKLLDLELDYDERLIQITRDGSVNPVYLTTPDAHRAAAVLATLAGL